MAIDYEVLTTAVPWHGLHVVQKAHGLDCEVGLPEIAIQGYDVNARVNLLQSLNASVRKVTSTLEGRGLP